MAQALLGTLFTWGLTALGASMAIFLQGNQRYFLDVSLGFASGVMLAASYWSLLDPAVEMASSLPMYGDRGQLAWIPVAVGFFLGAAFVYAADVVMTHSGITSAVDIVQKNSQNGRRGEGRLSPEMQRIGEEREDGMRRRRRTTSTEDNEDGYSLEEKEDMDRTVDQEQRWRRILLLIVAITVHNIPEGLAVGVGFGAVGKTKSATFESARNLAIGIGIQNFPEGIAVSLPLKAAGISTARAVWYGQLSGMVEPIAGVIGAALVTFIVPILPYALAFAAGAMVYVVIDDIIPEAQSQGNGKAASWGAIVGFIVMMSLDKYVIR